MSDGQNLAIVQLRDADDPASASVERMGIPFLRAFLRALLEWERFEECNCARRYQLQLTRAATLWVKSPFTGTPVPVTHSFSLRHQMFFYAVADMEPLFLIASALGAGYPLNGALFPSRRLLLQIGHSHEWSPQPAHIAMLSDAMALRRGPADAGKARPIVVTGDNNFAHCAWNQFGALEFLIGCGLMERVEKMAIAGEPLGRIEELFPEFNQVPAIRISHIGLEQFNGGDSLLIPLAGVRLSKAVRGRVIRHASRKLSGAGAALRDRLARLQGLPTFWVSVRTRNRTPVNQVDFAVELVAALRATFGACNILFDGHSTPMDCDDNPELDRHEMHMAIAGDRLIVDQIRGKLDRRMTGRGGGEILEAVGLSILDSIMLAQFADFYVCHHGTIQHKIGWFHPVPGVVHTNKAYLLHPPGPWVAAQSDCAIEPDYIKSEWITDLDRPEQYRHCPEHMPLQNYRIDNIDAAVAFIVEKARAALRARHAPRVGSG